MVKLRSKPSLTVTDWAGCVDTRRSTIGFIVQIAGGPVSWKSKTMKTVAQSSCKAEFMGLTEVCKELMWLCNFLEELGNFIPHSKDLLRFSISNSLVPRSY